MFFLEELIFISLNSLIYNSSVWNLSLKWVEYNINPFYASESVNLQSWALVEHPS